MKIGLIGISGKPVTAGHWQLLQTASNENDRVILFVSTSDRKRKGEFPINGSDMARIWKIYLEKILPQNIIPYYGGSPIRRIYETIGKAEESGEREIVFQIYGDKTDVENAFTNKSLDKYFPRLFKSGQILKRGLQRKEITGRSGADARLAIAKNDLEMFKKSMPPPLSDKDKEAIWDLLKKKNENTIRDFVKEIL